MNMNNRSNYLRKTAYASKIYQSDFFVTFHLQNFIEEKIKSHINDGMFVLDIGCGEQPLRSLIEARGARYFGVDVTQNSFNNVDIVASITDMRLKDALFDCIICTEVLEHVTDANSAFIELTRILKPYGICILTTPFLYRLHEEPYDKIRLTIHSIEHYAIQNNLHIVELSKAGNELEVAATLLNYLFRAEKANIFIKAICKTITLLINLITVSFCWFLSFKSPAGYLNTVAVLVKDRLNK